VEFLLQSYPNFSLSFGGVNMTALGIIFITGSVICAIGIVYLLTRSNKKEKHA